MNNQEYTQNEVVSSLHFMVQTGRIIVESGVRVACPDSSVLQKNNEKEPSCKDVENRNVDPSSASLTDEMSGFFEESSTNANALPVK